MTNDFMLNALVSLVGVALAALPAWSACSRPIKVPVAAVGLSVIVEGQKISGVYPGLLRELGPRGGCGFEFEAVSRARLEMLFEQGQADVLVPATHSDRRDAWGEFVPLALSRPMALTLNSPRAPQRSLAEILSRRELKVAVVRGYDFGSDYRRFVEALREQGRLVQEVDPLAVLRALRAGLADLTVMSPLNAYAALSFDPRYHGLETQLRNEPLDELGWSESGLYLSLKGLSEADRRELRGLLQEALRSGAFWRLLQRHYSPEVLDAAMKPLPAR